MRTAADVLLVEDNREIRTLLREVLEERGYRVEVAANGEEALVLLRERVKPALILLDLVMPVMNGWQFRAAQEHDPELASIPVVILTGTTDGKKQAYALHAVGFLAKPFLPDKLLDAVDQRCGPSIVTVDARSVTSS